MSEPARATSHQGPAAPAGGAVPHPPRPALAFRVGVTGHRPDPAKGRPAPDVSGLRRTLATLLRQIADVVHGVAGAHATAFDLAASANPRGTVRLVSALAEGADQWAADEALKAGYELHCPIPFAPDVYVATFTDAESQQEFARLREYATVFALDGTRQGNAPSEDAYEAVEHALVNQSDLLLAVWDGLPPQGRGGTGAVVLAALQRGIPVVWIPWSAPEQWVLRLPEWRLLEHQADISDDVERLREQVQELLTPPAGHDSPNAHLPVTEREEYFKETPRRGRPLRWAWSVFQQMVTGRFSEDEASEVDPLYAPHLPAPLVAWLEASFVRHYKWANELSIYYAQMYRSAFLVSYLLAAVAVFFALIGTALHWEHVVFTYVELLIILTILGLTWYGRRQRWHERWVDYRMLAERLRLAQFLALLGGGGQPASVPAHLTTYGNPAATWMHWHYRAIERAAGLPDATVGAEYLSAVRTAWVTELVEEQRAYHRRTAERFEKIDHRLHRLGIGLFAATLVACGIHIVDSSREGLWVLLAAVLPALAAALAAIRGQAEAPRLARRSLAMEKSLEQMKLELASVPVRPDEGNSQRLRQAADRVTELMVKEMLDWRVVVLDRPLETHI